MALPVEHQHDLHSTKVPIYDAQDDGAQDRAEDVKHAASALRIVSGGMPVLNTFFICRGLQTHWMDAVPGMATQRDV